MTYAILRFVHCKELLTDLTNFNSDFPNGYSHVEAVTTDGKYLGAHVSGVEARSMDYDVGKFERELFMLLPISIEARVKWIHYLRAVEVKHEGYNLISILGFVTHFDLTKPGTTVCSALQTLALRWCLYFPRPFNIPAHMISVRDLYLGLMMRSDIEIIEKSDPRFIAHISAGI